VSLQLQSPSEPIAKSLVEICQNKIAQQDELLLEYAYRLIIEATVRSNPKLDSISTVGNEGVKAWQNAAALKATKKDRKNLWDDFFTAAMRHGCWDDARTVCRVFTCVSQISDDGTHICRQS
jgi:N-terminal acetyltransferase B complex non-catalytic subunit